LPGRGTPAGQGRAGPGSPMPATCCRARRPRVPWCWPPTCTTRLAHQPTVSVCSCRPGGRWT